MEDNIVKFIPKDAASSPDVVLEAAKGEYTKVVILGFDEYGNLDPRASLNITYQEILWMLELFKHNLLDGNYFE